MFSKHSQMCPCLSESKSNVSVFHFQKVFLKYIYTYIYTILSGFGKKEDYVHTDFLLLKMAELFSLVFNTAAIVANLSVCMWSASRMGISRESSWVTQAPWGVWEVKREDTKPFHDPHLLGSSGC